MIASRRLPPRTLAIDDKEPIIINPVNVYYDAQEAERVREKLKTGEAITEIERLFDKNGNMKRRGRR